MSHDCKHSVAIGRSRRPTSQPTLQSKKHLPDDPSKRLSAQERQELKQAQLKMQWKAKASREAAQSDQQVSQWLELFGKRTCLASRRFDRSMSAMHHVV